MTNMKVQNIVAGNTYWVDADCQHDNPITLIVRRNHKHVATSVTYCDEDANMEHWVKADPRSSVYMKDGKRKGFDGILKMYNLNLTK